MKAIFHIDVNSAYLSWEATARVQKGDTFDLRTVPSAVGGDPQKRKGIILAKSIPAKQFGIKTGETLNDAYNKCPELIIVPPNYRLYMKFSQAMNEIFEKYSPLVQRYSIDESFIDYTQSINLFGDPLKAAEEIKNRIRDELGFTVSVGVSTNKLLAKMASDIGKADTVTTLYPEEIQKKMWSLPVSDLFMVGRKTTKKLENLNINTIGELANTELYILESVLKSHGRMVWKFANGIESSSVNIYKRKIKGLGNSTTTPYDIRNENDAFLVLLSLCETVGMRLRHEKLMTSLVTVTIKTDKFYRFSHQRKIDIPINNTNAIYKLSKRLFKELWSGEVVRHIGVRVSALESENEVQLSLFETEGTSEKEKNLEKAIDQLRLKYNNQCIIRGSFANQDIKPLQGGIGEEDYPMVSSIL